MIGALSISGAPPLNGFVSKSLVLAAAEQSHREVIVALLTLASVGTFLSVGLKLPFLAFGGEPRGATIAPVPKAMFLAMGLTAGLCFLTGVTPRLGLRTSALRPDVRAVHRGSCPRCRSASGRDRSRIHGLLGPARGHAARDPGYEPHLPSPGPLDRGRARAAGRRRRRPPGGGGHGRSDGRPPFQRAAASAGYGVLLTVVVLGLGVALLSLFADAGVNGPREYNADLHRVRRATDLSATPRDPTS